MAGSGPRRKYGLVETGLSWCWPKRAAVHELGIGDGLAGINLAFGNGSFTGVPAMVALLSGVSPDSQAQACFSPTEANLVAGMKRFDLPDTVAGRRRLVERLDRRAVEEEIKNCGMPIVPEKVDGGVLFLRHNHGLNPNEKTLPELLNEQGYVTALIGKWHLGNQDMFQRLKHGFDTSRPVR